MRAEFAAPWARGLGWLSAVVVVALTVAIVVVWTAVPPGWLRWSAIAGLVLVVASGVVSMVLGYRVEGRSLYIQRPLRETVIPLEGLRSVETDPTALRGSLRLLGNGGFLSLTGWYWNRRLGRYRMFVTHPKKAVVLRWRDRVVVVSPADPAQFAECLRGLSHG